MNIKIGTIVLYHLTPQETDCIRNNGGGHCEGAHPAMVVKIHDHTMFPMLNLKVFVDGPTDIWKENVFQGVFTGQYSIME